MGEREELEALRAAGKKFAEQRENTQTQHIKPPLSNEEKRLLQDKEELSFKKALQEYYPGDIIPGGTIHDLLSSSSHDRHIGELTLGQARGILAETGENHRKEKDRQERIAIRHEWERNNPALVAKNKRLEEERFKRDSVYSPPPPHDSGDVH